MANSTIGAQVPAGDGWIATRLKELERRIDELSAARTLQAAEIGAGGLTISGGQIRLRNPAGELVGIIGQSPTPGSNSYGIQIWRPGGGGPMLYAATLDGGLAPLVGFWDAAGHNPICTDEVGGIGIASPHLTLSPLLDTNGDRMPATTATTWTTIATCSFERENPGIQWEILGLPDNGTTGQLRLVLDGTVIATSAAITTGGAWWSASYLFPAGWSWNGFSVLNLDAIVTAGGGTMRGQPSFLSGRQS